MTQTLQPKQRISSIDALRGFSLIGIVLLHCMEHFDLTSYPEYTSELMQKIDTIVYDVIRFFVQGKSYAIFSMLFGLSFFIQHDNQAQQGKDFRLRFVWRMVLLFCWGLFDLLFYNGDILTVYAVCGLCVIPFIRANNKVLVAATILFALQPIELFYIVKGLIDPATQSFNLGSSELFKSILPAQSEGNILDVAVAGLRYGFPVNFTWAIEHGRMTQTIFLFLLGIYLGRKRLFYDEGNNIEIWKRVLVGSLCAFVVLYPLCDAVADVLAATPKMDRTCVQKSLKVMLTMWRNLAMMLCYVSGVVLLYYRTSARNFLSKIAPYGKMSLTNYLSQSIIGGFVFYNWGLGMFRYSGHTSSLLLGVLCIALQYAFCRWWLKNHSHGPFELVWRKLTWLGKK